MVGVSPVPNGICINIVTSVRSDEGITALIVFVCPGANDTV